MIEEILQCIGAFPGFGGFRLRCEALGPESGDGALICLGREVISRRRDILGSEKRRVRLALQLLLNLPHDPLASDPEMSQTLLAFAPWLRENAPIFGENQAVFAEKGKLAAADGSGIARYQCRVIFEFDE